MPPQRVQDALSHLSKGHLPGVIFSDIDGTIVHYDKDLPSQGYRLVEQILDGSGDHDGLNRGVAIFNHPSRRRRLTKNIEANGGNNDTRKETGTEDLLSEYDEIRCWKVPSLTLGGGYISFRTIDLVNQLREEYGVHLVLMTGARSSTMVARRRSGTLPRTAYDICEGGGKIWHRRSPIGINYNHEEIPVDEEWSAQFEALCGSHTQLESDPLLREGPMWDIYRQLHNEGYALDAKSFSASFMVLVGKCEVVMSGKQTVCEVEANMKRRFLPPDGEFSNKGFIYLTNLSKGQIVPEKSGKHNAATYVLKQLLCPVSSIDTEEIYNKKDDASTLKAAWATSIALFDDENDLEFAALCGAGFIPSVAHSSVIPAIEKYNRERREKILEGGEALCESSSLPDCFVRTSVDGPLGTEEALEAILHCCQASTNGM